jgi:predicted membrane chloride channel (bestrophin family)
MVSLSLDGVYGRLAIFIVFLVAFTLYGIEGIAEEIGPLL